MNEKQWWANRGLLRKVEGANWHVSEILQVMIQNSGSFGRKLGSVEAIRLNVPNTPSFQVCKLFVCVNDTDYVKNTSVMRSSHQVGNKVLVLKELRHLFVLYLFVTGV